jgi:hypothetical protein
MTPIADFNALVAAWNSTRGGWRAAWQDSMQLLARRRVLVDTRADTPLGERIVLRTRVRLTGDTQTDVFRGWLEAAPAATVEAIASAHFRSVGDAARGWLAVRAMVRLGSQLIVAASATIALVTQLQALLAAGWRALIPALLGNWWSLTAIALLILGIPLRWLLRLWMRRKFRMSLSIGPVRR